MYCKIVNFHLGKVKFGISRLDGQVKCKFLRYLLKEVQRELTVNFLTAASQKMIINILDDNDNSPEFPQPKEYFFTMPEVSSC